MNEDIEIKNIVVTSAPSNDAGLLELSLSVAPYFECGIASISLETKEAGENVVVMV